jgi:aminobutyraldehyde dehydrogenase
VEINEASEAQVDAAVRAADAAFDSWSQTPPKERSLLLLKLADAIEAHGEELAKLESDNCGKPYSAALNDEIPAIADVFRFFAGASRCMSGSAGGEYLPGHTSMIRRDPVGVIASIAPWNYPLMMVAWKIAPALAAGNTVVLKPSEQTPLTALRLAQLASEISRPACSTWCSAVAYGRQPAGHPPESAHGVADRLDRHRLEHHFQHRRQRETHAHGTGRQGPGDHLRRRRHRRRGGRHSHLRLLQRRAGLHRRLPHLCAGRHLRKFVEKLGAAVSSIKYGLQDDPSTELGPLITRSTATASPGSSNAPWRSRTSA